MAEITYEDMSEETGQVDDEKRVEGVGFWVFVGLAFFKDGVDLLLGTLGLISAGTLLLPLTVPLLFLSVGLYAAIWAYLRACGVTFSITQLAALTLTFLIEIFPLTAFLPGATLWLFLARWIANSRTAHTATRRVAKK